MRQFREKGLEHSDLLDTLFECTTQQGKLYGHNQGVLPNDSVRPCQEIPSNSNYNNGQNLEDIFVETPELNDIWDAGIFDMRPDHVGNTNDYATYVEIVHPVL